MCFRFAAIHVASLCFIGCCSQLSAVAPLVVAELEAERVIAQADAERAIAAMELAQWKLDRLDALRDAGQASWQELAQQRVATKSAEAEVKSANQFLQFIRDLQLRLGSLTPNCAESASESIRLYLPGSAQIAAWISTDVASEYLLKRHLEELLLQQNSMSQIDLPPLYSAVKLAEQALNSLVNSGQDDDQVRRSASQLRLSKAIYELASARGAASEIISRRIALVRKSLERNQADERDSTPRFAVAGTPFIVAFGDQELAALVATMAKDAGLTNEPVAWLEHQHDDLAARIGGLQKLSYFSASDRQKIDQSRKQQQLLQQQIQLSRSVLELRQNIAAAYEAAIAEKSVGSPTENQAEQASAMDLPNGLRMDPTVVRHSLQLESWKLRTAANRTAVSAQRDYLVERMKRVASIPANARPPRELEQMQRSIAGTKQQLAMIEQELSMLGIEQRRFVRQVQVQNGQQYQLVQAESGEFISRGQMDIMRAMIATVGFIGDSQFFPKTPQPYAYMESPLLLDGISMTAVPMISTLQNTTAGSTCPLFRAAARSRDSNDLGFAERSSIKWDRSEHAADGLRSDAARLWETFSDDLVGRRSVGLYGQPWGSGYLFPYSGFQYAWYGQCSISYRANDPNRCSYPYRSSYLYRSAFPVRGDLNGNPYSQPSDLFGGNSYTTGFGAICFD